MDIYERYCTSGRRKALPGLDFTRLPTVDILRDSPEGLTSNPKKPAHLLRHFVHLPHEKR